MHITFDWASTKPVCAQHPQAKAFSTRLCGSATTRGRQPVALSPWRFVIVIHWFSKRLLRISSWLELGHGGWLPPPSPNADHSAWIPVRVWLFPCHVAHWTAGMTASQWRSSITPTVNEYEINYQWFLGKFFGEIVFSLFRSLYYLIKEISYHYILILINNYRFLRHFSWCWSVISN